MLFFAVIHELVFEVGMHDMTMISEPWGCRGSGGGGQRVVREMVRLARPMFMLYYWGFDLMYHRLCDSIDLVYVTFSYCRHILQ